MKTRRSSDRFYTYGLGLILAAGLILRLWLIFTMQYQPLEWDQLNYTELAVRWWETGVYGYMGNEQNTLVTPGFPVFLVLVFGLFGYHPIEHGLMIVRVLQCLIGMGAVWFIYKLGERLFNRSAGLLAAFFAAVYAQYIMSASLILTEIVFLTCFTALLFFQVRVLQENRPWDHVWMGALLAATVLIRPNVLPLAVIPYLFLWVRHRKLYLPMIVRSAAAFAVVMMPWWVRSAMVFHQFIFIGQGGSGNPFLAGTDPYFRGGIDTATIKPEEQFAEGLRRLRQGLIHDPWLWIKWYTAGKFQVFFLHRWVGPYPSYIPEWLNTFQEKLHYVLVFAGWIWLLVSCFFNRSSAYLLVSLLAFLAIHSLFVPVDRYSYGMMPFLMIGTAHLAVTAVRLVSGQAKTPVKA